MATKFVNSGAAGLNDGTSWTDAWTSLASSNGVAAGDTVKVHKTHSQTGLGANINWSNGTASNPVKIVCVDKDAADALSTGASVEWTTTGLGPQGNVLAYGMSWKQTGALLTLTGGTDGFQVQESCTLVCTGASGVAISGTRSAHYWKNTNVDLSGASSGNVEVQAGDNLQWVGGTYTCRSAQTALFRSVGLPRYVAGVTFSGTVTNISALTSAIWGASRTRFVGCIAPTYTTALANSPDQAGEADLSGLHASGTITAANLSPALFQGRCGTLVASLTRYRTGGADDGSQANAYSWEVVTNANANPFTSPLVLPPMSRWVSAGASQTVTVYVASGGSLNDDDVYLEVLSPSELGSPTALATYKTTRPAPLAANAALTTDGTSTWTGAGVGTKQKVSATISPTIAGRVIVRVCVAKASSTIYVDPVLDIASATGKSRFVEGVQTFDATESGGGANRALLPSGLSAMG